MAEYGTAEYWLECAARAERRAGEMERFLHWLRYHATNPDWTTPDGAVEIVNRVEAVLFGSEDAEKGQQHD